MRLFLNFYAQYYVIICYMSGALSPDYGRKYVVFILTVHETTNDQPQTPSGSDDNIQSTLVI